MNVTATGPTSDGYFAVFPCGNPVPNASNLNYKSGASIANLVISKLGARGDLCIKTSAATHLIVDVTGYFPAGSSYEALQPARLLYTSGRSDHRQPVQRCRSASVGNDHGTRGYWSRRCASER